MNKEGRETLIKFKIIQAYTDETLVKRLTKLHNDETVEVVSLNYSTSSLSTDKVLFTALVGFKEKTDKQNILG